MAEPETVSLEARQAGLGSVSRHCSCKRHQAGPGTQESLNQWSPRGRKLSGLVIGHGNVRRPLPVCWRRQVLLRQHGSRRRCAARTEIKHENPVPEKGPGYHRARSIVR